MSIAEHGPYFGPLIDKGEVKVELVEKNNFTLVRYIFVDKSEESKPKKTYKVLGNNTIKCATWRCNNYACKDMTDELPPQCKFCCQSDEHTHCNSGGCANRPNSKFKGVCQYHYNDLTGRNGGFPE